MKLTKSQIKDIIKETIEEELEEYGPDVSEDVEEGITGAALGALLAKRPGGPGHPQLGVDDVIKMAAGGYFGHKIQNFLNQNKKKRKDDE
jgi:outer membrane lipoprotein SlyB